MPFSKSDVSYGNSMTFLLLNFPRFSCNVHNRTFFIFTRPTRFIFLTFIFYPFETWRHCTTLMNFLQRFGVNEIPGGNVSLYNSTSIWYNYSNLWLSRIFPYRRRNTSDTWLGNKYSLEPIHGKVQRPEKPRRCQQ